MSTPSIRTRPRSGLNRAATCFRMTLFPWPLPPIKARISPFPTSQEIPFRTANPSNDLCRSSILITAPSKQGRRHHIVPEKDQDGREHDGLRGRLTDTL